MTYLNVVLHGLYLAVHRKESIEILIPDMGAEHTYRAGEWLGERVLAQGTYFLTGVKRGDGTCDGKQTLLVHSCKPVANPNALYARIIMPRAKKVFNLGQLHLSQDELLVHPSIQLSSYVLSTLQVYLYEIPDGDPRSVKLGCHWFRKSAQRFGDGNDYMSLHIFSAPDHPEIPSHTQSGFATLVGMGEGLIGKMALNSTQPVPDPSADIGRVPTGLIPAELKSLSARTDRLNDIGRFLREINANHQNAANIASSSFVGVDGDIVTCTNYGLQPGD